jgi:hypothetical protein
MKVRPDISIPTTASCGESDSKGRERVLVYTVCVSLCLAWVISNYINRPAYWYVGMNIVVELFDHSAPTKKVHITCAFTQTPLNFIP